MKSFTCFFHKNLIDLVSAAPLYILKKVFSVSFIKWIHPIAILNLGYNTFFKSIFLIKISYVEFINPVCPLFFAIFQPNRIFKFWILIDSDWIFDPVPRSFGIDVGLGPFHIRTFSIYYVFHTFLKKLEYFSTDIAD
jgi:hypothetical protein